MGGGVQAAGLASAVSAFVWLNVGVRSVCQSAQQTILFGGEGGIIRKQKISFYKSECKSVSCACKSVSIKAGAKKQSRDT